MRRILLLLSLSFIAVLSACQSSQPTKGNGSSADSSGEPRPDAGNATTTNREMKGDAEPDRKGCVQGDCETGTGAFIYEGGDRYTGSFKAGLREGKGIMEYANGDRYEGTYVNDQRDGQGSYTYKNGDVYVGQFKNGGREGSGTYRFAASGETYVGEFRDDGSAGDGTFKRGDEQLHCTLKGKSVFCEPAAAPAPETGK